MQLISSSCQSAETEQDSGFHATVTLAKEVGREPKNCTQCENTVVLLQHFFQNVTQVNVTE